MPKPPPLLNQAQIERDRLATMARVFARADRVLSGESVTCTIVDQPNNRAPAWTDGRDISLNQAHIGSVSEVNDIIKVTGLNYHELCHVLYTPRRHTAYVRAISAKNQFRAYNMLEDQRIETLLVAKYKSTQPFFVAVIMRYLLAHREQWKTAFTLLHGRKYLPQDVRDQAEARFTNPELVADFKRVIDQYRVLAFPRDYDKGLPLVQEYADLLAQMSGQPTGDPFGHLQGQRPDAPTAGSAQPQEKVAAKAEQETKDDKPEPSDDEVEDDDVEGSGSDLDDDTNDDDIEDDDDGIGSQSDDEDDEDWPEDEEGGDDEDGDDSSEDFPDDEHGNTGGDQTAGSGDSNDDGDTDDDGDEVGSGDGSSKGGPEAPPAVSEDDFADMLDAAAKGAESAPEVVDDAKSKQDTIVKGDGETMSVLDAQAYYDKNVPATVLATATRFTKQLRLLRDEQDPGWWREQPSGRLNVGRAMRGDDVDTVFDRWDEGKTDATDIEAVVLLDYSYSMVAMMEQASQALWAVKRSFEDVGARVTVIGFASGTTLMYDGSTPAHRTQYKSFAAAGGTNPGGALNEALRILHKSRRKTRYLITITDGEWVGHGQANPYVEKVERCNANGIVTAMLYLDDTIRPTTNMEQLRSRIDWNGHTVRALAANAGELAPFAQSIVKARLKQPQR